MAIRKDAFETVREQKDAMLRAGMRPTAILVGEDLFIEFFKCCSLADDVRQIGFRCFNMAGLPVAFMDKRTPFTVVTDGENA